MEGEWNLVDGIATVRHLLELGTRESSIRIAVRRGDLIRIRRGVVARPDGAPEIVAAAQLGGRVAGASAAGLHGLWGPPGSRLVVEVPRGVHVPPSDALVLRGPAGPSRFGVSSIPELVPQVLRSEPRPFAVAILDSILRRSGMTRPDLESAAAALPVRLRSMLSWVDARAESGTESVVRVALATAGIPATPQARLPFRDLERADLLVGDRIVVECDSREHHSAPAALDRDADRDLALTALGFHVIRVRYRIAMSDPDAVVAAVRAALRFTAPAPPRRDTP